MGKRKRRSRSPKEIEVKHKKKSTHSNKKKKKHYSPPSSTYSSFISVSSSKSANKKVNIKKKKKKDRLDSETKLQNLSNNINSNKEIKLFRPVDNIETSNSLIEALPAVVNQVKEINPSDDINIMINIPEEINLELQDEEMKIDFKLVDNTQSLQVYKDFYEINYLDIFNVHKKLYFVI